MLKIYGTSMSRANRALWGAEELGLKFEHLPIVPGSGTRTPDHLKLNPNGHVPVIDDDGVIIWESMAVNLYLAEKYGKAPFWPSSVADHGRCYQWSTWAMTEVEPHTIAIFLNTRMLPEPQRDAGLVTRSREALVNPLRVLNDHLKSHEYLLGKDFTVADLNVASVVSLGLLVGVDFSSAPAAKAWIEKCTSRPASQKARAYK